MAAILVTGASGSGKTFAALDLAAAIVRGLPWFGRRVRRGTVAYIAAGVWHRWLVTGDRAWVEHMWPCVEKAIDFVLDLQTPRGEILWARHADGTPWSFALLTGSSSMCHSLRCAVAVAELLDHERPDWELSAARLAQVIRAHCNGQAPDAFAPKARWAMDWYYPVLGGVLRDDEAHARMDARRGSKGVNRGN